MNEVVPHSSLLPKLLKVMCTYCYLNNTKHFPCAIGYFVENIGKWLAQPAICVGSPPLPFPINKSDWYGPFLPCYNYSNTKPIKGISNCELPQLSQNAFNSSCLGPLKRSHLYQCSSYNNNRWYFYPDEPDFYTYGLFSAYLALCGICFLATLLLNCLTISVYLKSKLLKSSKSYVFGLHMAVIDLLVAIACISPYGIIIYQKNQYFFHGEKLVSENTLKQIDKWFNRFDLLLLLASFSNLAILSLERCVAISKPFWSMRYVTTRVIFISLPTVWGYSLALFFIHLYAYQQVWLSFFAGFVIPTIIMTSCYIIIIYQIKHTNSVSIHDIRLKSKQRKEFKVTTNVFGLITIFIACWLPYFVVLLIYSEESEHKRTSQNTKINMTFITTYRWFKLLSYCHCFLDPLIYALSKPKVKREVKSMTKIGSRFKIPLPPKTT